MNKPNIDNYISLEEAAKYMGIKSVTLRGWIKDASNGLPTRKQVSSGSSSIQNWTNGLIAERVR